MVVGGARTFTILKRTQSNPTVSQQTKTSLIEGQSCANNEENKFTVSDKDLYETSEKSIVNDEENECNIETAYEELLNTDIGQKSPSLAQNLNHSSEFVKSSGSQNDSYSEICDIFPQTDKENINPVEILPKHSSSTTFVKTALQLPSTSKFLTVNDVESNMVENSWSTSKFNPRETEEKTVTMVEDENHKVNHSNDVSETIGTSKSITILKRPNSNVSLSMIKQDEEIVKDEVEKSLENVRHPVINYEETPTLNEKRYIEENTTENKTDEEGEVFLTNVTILKRPECFSHRLLENKSGQSVKTLEQRQKEYDEARMRIFGEISSENSSQEEENEPDDVPQFVNKRKTSLVENHIQIGEDLKERSVELVEAVTVSDLNPEFPEFCPQGKKDFYIDVDSYTKSTELTQSEVYKKSNPKIYSNGSQHPLQYYHQPVPNCKPFYNGSAQYEYYFPQSDSESYFGQFSNGGIPNFNCIPFGSRANFTDNPHIQNFSSSYAEMFYPNFCSYDQANLTFSNYVEFDQFSCDFGIADFDPDFVADSNFYSFANTNYADIDDAQSLTSGYHQTSCNFDASTVESAVIKS